jgi:2-oxoglutarate dehydrogenase E2 component (dihydrolipoamide succinyltransferase)
MATDVIVPTLGESITEATLGQWLKQPGDPVKADEPIASLETDKVAVEVPSPVAGAMASMSCSEGDTVAVGALIARIEAAAARPRRPAPKRRRAATTPPAQARLRCARGPDGPARGARHEDDRDLGSLTLSPAVRRVVLEHGLDPVENQGHRQGRAPHQGRRARRGQAERKKAQSRARKPRLLPSRRSRRPSPQSGERREERVRMTRLRQTIARRLKEAQNTAALLTTFNDVDMTAVIEARGRYKDLFEKKHGIRLGFMGFFVKAAVLAARDIPSVNAYIEGDEIVYHDYMDVSVAVSAPNGLVVPIIRNADKLSFAEIEKTIADFGRRAKEGSLKMEEMQGGTFTISNGGVFGSLLSTPIINPPQSAVLGMHRIEERPVVRGGQIVARPMMYLASPTTTGSSTAGKR